jgi:hypothetical protein
VLERPRCVTLKADSSTHILGDRAYVLRLRKACTEALKNGCAQFACDDQDDEEIYTVITCSKRLGKQKIGFR